MVKAVKKGMRGECPVAGAGAPGSGAPRTLFLTAFTINFLRFEGHFCCPVWVLRRDSFWGRVWYGKPTNLPYMSVGGAGESVLKIMVADVVTVVAPHGGSVPKRDWEYHTVAD